MRVVLRPATDADAVDCGRICYEAFSGVARAHGFPVDWQSEEVAVKVIAARLVHRPTYGVVAEVDGRIAGSAFLKVYHPVGAIGPVTVTPRLQGGEIGLKMMEHLMEHAREARLAGTRLVQAAYNTHSLALYVKLGFQIRDLLACLHGNLNAMRIRGYQVREGTQADAEECAGLGLRLHGYARTDDIKEALRLRIMTVAERDGRVTGYSTGIHFRGHTVGETNGDVKALVAAAEALAEPGLLMPAANLELLQWALQSGLRITQPLSLMTHGFYQEPQGAFLPSIHG